MRLSHRLAGQTPLPRSPSLCLLAPLTLRRRFRLSCPSSPRRHRHLPYRWTIALHVWLHRALVCASDAQHGTKRKVFGPAVHRIYRSRIRWYTSILGNEERYIEKNQLYATRLAWSLNADSSRSFSGNGL